MGRGGRRGGGIRSGGFSRGGSRGFSSRRSSGSSRGGFRSSGSSGSLNSLFRSTRRSGSYHRPPVIISTPIFSKRNKTVYVNDGNDTKRKYYHGNNPAAKTNTKLNNHNRTLINFIIISMIIMIILFIFSFVSYSNMSDHKTREKLEDGICIANPEWIDDELSWIGNRDDVVNAMNYFYGKTGVQPYLFITDNINGKGEDVSDPEAEEYIGNMYDSLYNDEGHMIFTFMEYAPSEYITWIYTGSAADSVIDNDARNIILDYTDRYYYSDLSDDEFFEKVFEKSADDIMKDPVKPYSVSMILAFMAGTVMVILILAYAVININESKRKKLEKIQEIANTPIGPSAEEKELIDKYSDQ